MGPFEEAPCIAASRWPVVDSETRRQQRMKQKRPTHRNDSSVPAGKEQSRATAVLAWSPPRFPRYAAAWALAAVTGIALSAHAQTWRAAIAPGHPTSVPQNVNEIYGNPLVGPCGHISVNAGIWSRTVAESRTAILVEFGGTIEPIAYMSHPPTDPRFEGVLSRPNWWTAPDCEGRPGLHYGYRRDETFGRALFRGNGPGSFLADTALPAPGLDEGEVFTTFRSGHYESALKPAIMSPDGSLLVWAELTGPTVASNTSGCLYLFGPEGPRLLSRAGRPDQGAPGNEDLGFLFAGAAAGPNFIAVHGFLPSMGTVGYWDGERFRRIVADRQQAPGLPEGVKYVYASMTSHQPGVNQHGMLAFGGTADFRSEFGIHPALWAGPPQAIRCVFDPRRGADFVGPGIRAVWIEGPLLTGRGSVAAVFTLAGLGVTADNDTALAIHHDGEWTLIAREGDPITGDGGAPLRQIQLANASFNRFDQCVLFSPPSGTIPATLHLWEPGVGIRTILKRGDLVRLPYGDAVVVSISFVGGSGGQDGRSSGLGDQGIVTAAINLHSGGQGSAVLSANLAPPCPGDWNTDGGVDGADLQAFFTAWEAGEADANRDGGTDGADVETFIIAWEAGC